MLYSNWAAVYMMCVGVPVHAEKGEHCGKGQFVNTQFSSLSLRKAIHDGRVGALLEVHFKHFRT